MAADPHSGDSLVPSVDHWIDTQPEAEGLVSRDARVEDRTISEVPDVMDGHDSTGDGLGAVAYGVVPIEEPRGKLLEEVQIDPELRGVLDQPRVPGAGARSVVPAAPAGQEGERRDDEDREGASDHGGSRWEWVNDPAAARVHGDSESVSRVPDPRHHMTPSVNGHAGRALRALAGSTALAALVPAALPAQSAQVILERAAERYEALAAFCADFRQQIDVTLLRETTRSAGELCQARPDRFEMRFTDPAGDRVVADGVYLWVYFPSVDDGQVVRLSLASGNNRMDLHREFLSEPGRRYAATLEGRETVDGRECHILSLTPQVASPYRRARVWIDASDFLIRRLVIVEESESVRTLDLSNIRLNPSLDAARFRFDPPPGVQVIAR